MKIEWTDPSISDLAAIRDYIALDSEENAIRFIGRLIESVEKISDFPQMGRRVPEAGDETIREIIFSGYRIVYRLNPGLIQIISVLHGSRDLSGMIPKPWEVH
jgi:toxin ParE1/3/4